MTQVRGGTLDHVITRSHESISDLCVDPPGIISDHSLITWTLPFAFQPSISERRTVRGWKRVNMNLLRQSIRDFELCAEIPESATVKLS